MSWTNNMKALPEARDEHHQDVQALRIRAEKAEAEVARLREELGACIQFAAEGWSYASHYFREKWGYAEVMAEFAGAIMTPRSTSARPGEP